MLEVASRIGRSKSLLPDVLSSVWDRLWPVSSTSPAASAPQPPAVSPVHTPPAAAPPARPEPRISINPGVVVSQHAVAVLRGVLLDAGAPSATITSGRRTADDQARVMHHNLVTLGVASQRSLYKTSGNRVIDIFEEQQRAGATADQIRAAMAAAIVAIGPSAVSNHCNPSYDTFDVATRSIEDAKAFVAALERAKAAGKLKGFIEEGRGMAYHLDVKRVDV